MKITLLHPSRGRARKAAEACVYWITSAQPDTKIEYILSIDIDDPFDYESIFDEIGLDKLLDIEFTVIRSHNKSVVEATNKAAAKATGDILVYLSDDFKCPENWDVDIIQKLKGRVGPALLKVDDCLQKFEVPVLTIPIMNKQLYDKLGYFWHPGYKSMFVDEDLYWTCQKNDWLMFDPDLKFPHEHCCNGKAENDETYKRSAANWDQGKAFFAQRKAAGFPL